MTEVQPAETFGKLAYEAYCKAVDGNVDGNGRIIRGDLAPKWENLPVHFRKCWHEAAWAVVDKVRKIYEHKHD